MKELRVKVKLRLHRKLHMLKILKGKNMAEAVEEALEDYFAKMNFPDLHDLDEDP